MSDISEKGQKFIDKYSVTWPNIIKSPLGIYYAYCTTCQTSFSVKHSGRYDVQRHIEGSKHTKNLEALQGVPKIDTFVNPKLVTNEKDVTNAECLMTNFSSEHNLPVV